MHRRALALLISSPIALAAGDAAADVTISTHTTRDMTCMNGICSPTAKDAVLNVGDLEALLASGAVTVTTTGSGEQARAIHIAGPFGWSSGNALSLDAQSSIAVDAAVEVGSTTALTLTTRAGGTGGALTFGRKGHFSFASTFSALIIDGVTYRLESDLAALGYDIARKPGGAFALAGNIDASGGVWSTPPVNTTFEGILQGLGNSVANLTIEDQSDTVIGLIAVIGEKGVVRDIGLSGAEVDAFGGNQGPSVGVLSGSNEGSILGARTAGRAKAPGSVGGIVGANAGTISRCWSSTLVAGKYQVGGLVGENYGLIDSSFATGHVTGAAGWVGGLAGFNGATIANSYATGQVKSHEHGEEGGLVGLDNGGSIGTSYATGKVINVGGLNVGGFLGEDEGSVANDYWDTTTSGTTNGVGGGNEANVTGLTTAQLRAGLPTGFDPKIWAEDANINGGLPYLTSNPPS